MLERRNSEEIDIEIEPVRQFNAGDPSPPPFLSPERGGGKVRRWWRGLTVRSKAGIAAAAGIIVVVVAVSWITAAMTNGDSARPPIVATTTLSRTTVSHFTGTVCTLRLSGLAHSAGDTVDRASGTTSQLLAEISYLSRSTGRGLFHARSPEAARPPGAGAGRTPGSGEPPKTDWDRGPDGEAEMIRNGNRIAEQYIPLYQSYEGEMEAVRVEAERLVPPPRLEASRDMLLVSCDTLSGAMAEYVRGLELLRDTNHEKVLEADKVIQNATRMMYEGANGLQLSVGLLGQG